MTVIVPIYDKLRSPTWLLDKNRRLLADMSKEAVFVHTTSGEKHKKTFNLSGINVTLHQ